MADVQREQMGIDRGFDMYPPLEDNHLNNQKWMFFLNDVIVHYEAEGDHIIRLDKKRNVVFAIGEHPTLTRRGHQFRRFGAKVSGDVGFEVEAYILHVQRMAQRYFGDRVVPWYEGADEFGVYTWDEVRAAANEGTVSLAVVTYLLDEA